MGSITTSLHRSFGPYPSEGLLPPFQVARSVRGPNDEGPALPWYVVNLGASVMDGCLDSASCLVEQEKYAAVLLECQEARRMVGKVGMIGCKKLR